MTKKAKVPSGSRNRTAKMLIALHKHLNIPTDTLLGWRGGRHSPAEILSQHIASR